MNTTCCDHEQGQDILLGDASIPESVVSSIRATGISTASSASQITASTVLTSTSASILASTSLSASAPGLGLSAKIGIGVGISFGILLVALLTFIAFRLYKNSQSNSLSLGRAEKAAPEPTKLREKNVDIGLQQRHELAAADIPKEMYTLHNTHEVEANSGASELRNFGTGRTVRS